MGNRLEHEFPAVRWRAAFSRGLDHELLHTALARGRLLQGAAVRHGVRRVLPTLAGALAGLIRSSADAVAERPLGQGCPPPTQGSA